MSIPSPSVHGWSPARTETNVCPLRTAHKRDIHGRRGEPPAQQTQGLKVRSRTQDDPPRRPCYCSWHACTRMSRLLCGVKNVDWCVCVCVCVCTAPMHGTCRMLNLPGAALSTTHPMHPALGNTHCNGAQRDNIESGRCEINAHPRTPTSSSHIPLSPTIQCWP